MNEYMRAEAILKLTQAAHNMRDDPVQYKEILAAISQQTSYLVPLAKTEAA